MESLYKDTWQDNILIYDPNTEISVLMEDRAIVCTLKGSEVLELVYETARDTVEIKNLDELEDSHSTEKDLTKKDILKEILDMAMEGIGRHKILKW